MAQVTIQGSPVQTSGDLPAVGTAAPPFKLVGTDLSEEKLQDYAGEFFLGFLKNRAGDKRG